MQIVLNMLIASAHYSLVALGFGLIFSTARFFHFTYAAIYTTAAYGAYAAFQYCGNTTFGVTVGVIMGMALGSIMEAAIYSPLRRARASPIILLVSSLGLLLVVQAAISIVFGDQTRGFPIAAGLSHGVTILRARITGSQTCFLVIAFVEVVLLIITLKRTHLGTMLRAVANDGSLAALVGINVRFLIQVSFLIGSLLASSAGIFWAYNTALNPQMGFAPLLMGAVAVFIGGVGSLRGAIVGAVLVAICQHLSMWFFPGEWQDAIVFCLLIAFLTFRPQGLFGKSFQRAQV